MRSCLLLRKWSTSRLRVMVVTQVMNAPALDVVGIQGAEHLDEDFLGKILSVVAGSGETIANIVDTPVVALNDFLPCHCIAGYAATDQHGNDLGVFQPALPGTPGLSPRQRTARVLTPQYRYVFVGPKVRRFYKARHCSREKK